MAVKPNNEIMERCIFGYEIKCRYTLPVNYKASEHHLLCKAAYLLEVSGKKFFSPLC